MFTKRRWFSGKISRCHRDAPGSIPGRRTLLCHTAPPFRIFGQPISILLILAILLLYILRYPSLSLYISPHHTTHQTCTHIAQHNTANKPHKPHTFVRPYTAIHPRADPSYPPIRSTRTPFTRTISTSHAKDGCRRYLSEGIRS